jgi:hypothetical protein
MIVDKASLARARSHWLVSDEPRSFGQFSTAKIDGKVVTLNFLNYAVLAMRAADNYADTVAFAGWVKSDPRLRDVVQMLINRCEVSSDANPTFARVATSSNPEGWHQFSFKEGDYERLNEKIDRMAF